MIKGFVINDDMLKNGKPFGQDYFDELLERIKEIRASERRFYRLHFASADVYKRVSFFATPFYIINHPQSRILFPQTALIVYRS